MNVNKQMRRCWFGFVEGNPNFIQSSILVLKLKKGMVSIAMENAYHFLFLFVGDLFILNIYCREIFLVENIFDKVYYFLEDA